MVNDKAEKMCYNVISKKPKGSGVMKHKLSYKIISAALSAIMVVNWNAGNLFAKASNSKLPYISEVFIAYGKTEQEAKKWLVDNGWEPVDGDLNAGKNYALADDVASVMGIKRTADPNDAITDMAVMNMYGGYSFGDYEALVNEKKTEINEFIMSFVPAIEEYRQNYRGTGSKAGQKRAEYAHDLLNKFYDGEVDGEYAANDTGKPLGDLLLSKTSTELGQDKYNALSKANKQQYADLQQIILESSGPAVLVIEQTLALATDTSEQSWLERLQGLSGDNLTKNLAKYVPEAAGQNISPSVAENYLNSYYGDAAKTLSAEWDDIYQTMHWFELYNDEHELWADDDESPEDYSARLDVYFEELKEIDEKKCSDDLDAYFSASMLYDKLYSIDYAGEWGDTLGDFFNPMDGESYDEAKYFLPFAAALSEGQRAALEFLPLDRLLRFGSDSDAVMDANFTPVNELFGDNESISIYSGINRAIFRDGVALTSKAEMQKNIGYDPYGEIWDEDGIVSVVAYSGLAVGAVSLAVGITITATTSKFAEWVTHNCGAGSIFEKLGFRSEMDVIEGAFTETPFGRSPELVGYDVAHWSNVKKLTKVSTAGKWLMGIGGALMLASAAVKVAQLVKMYNRTFTKIPVMIVDEADIVTYLVDSNGNPVLDEKGNQKKNIDFNQFAYYQVVKCNRQAIGIHPDAQSGVSDYQSWGCGDAADLNCDIGKQWLALYTIKNPAKGDPIFADSLKVTYGEGAPNGYTESLHFFCYTHAMNLGDTAFAFNNDKNGVYLYWKSDKEAYTASSFSKGYVALAGIGGLIAGILGTTFALYPRRKKEIPDAPVAG